MDKKRSGCGCFTFLLIILAILIFVMIFTNPRQEEVVQELKNREGAISLIQVVKRDNYIVLSVYQIQVSSINQGLMKSKTYMGVLGQILEIE